MPERKAFSLAARVQSFGHAFRGVGRLLVTQHNAWIHALATAAVFALGIGDGPLRATDPTTRFTIQLDDETPLIVDETPILAFSPDGRTIAYQAKERIENPVFGFSVASAEGRTVFGSNTQIEEFPLPVVEGPGALELGMSPLPFMRGKFFFSFSIHSGDHLENYHRLENTHSISVTPATNEEGFVKLPLTWRRL